MLKGYKKEMVQDLVAFDNYYTESKANEWVNGGGFDVSRMPMV